MTEQTRTSESTSAERETGFLLSIPGMAERLQSAAAEPLDQGTDAQDLDWE